MPVPSSRPWRRLVVPLAVAGVLGLAACGTAANSAAAAPSTTGATADPAAPGSTGSDAADDAYRSCLAENGVTLPGRDGVGRPPRDPSAGSGQRGDDAGAPPSGAADNGAAHDDATGEAAGRGAPPAPPGVDATTWATAQQACADLAPTPPA